MTATERVVGVDPGWVSPARVRELSAVTVDSTDLDAWEQFATVVLDATVTRDADEVRVRIDEYPYRFRIRAGERDRIAGLAWLARDDAALSEIRDRSQARYTPAAPLTPGAAWAFVDHHGITHDILPEVPAGQAYQPGSHVSGYVTGTAGMGHVVFYDTTLEAPDALYLDVYGMNLRSDAKKTQVGGPGHFYGCNLRHHTVAALETPALAPAVMHVMIEMLDIDDVGQALDRAALGGWIPRTALGRHGDHVISFYVPTPTGFDLEIGCYGLLVDDHTWATTKHALKARAWGHTGIKPQPPQA